MELWIRSQNKSSLRKIIGLNITEGDGKYYIEEYDTDTLGEYKSKKRVLEVLDEIQTALLGQPNNKATASITLSISTNTIIYEMPEE